MAMADILRMIDNNSFVVKMKVNNFTIASECLANYRRTQPGKYLGKYEQH